MSFLMVGKKSIIVIYFLVTVLLQIIFSSYCFVTVNLAISVTVTVNRNHTGAAHKPKSNQKLNLFVFVS